MKTPIHTDLHPLVAGLVEATGRPLLDAAGLESFLNLPGDRVLFCGGDPARYPQCLDVAVVLPELLAAFPGLEAAVAGQEVEGVLQARYGFPRWPTLLFLRDGQYVGALCGMQDWPVYLARVAELLATHTSRPPTVSIPATTPATASCH